MNNNQTETPEEEIALITEIPISLKRRLKGYTGANGFTIKDVVTIAIDNHLNKCEHPEEKEIDTELIEQD